MRHRVVLIPGDGIGPDVTSAAVAVVSATGVDIDWDVHQVGAPALAAGGAPLGDDVLAAIAAAGVALKGPVSTPRDRSFASVNLGLRRELDLFVQLRPCRSWPGVPSRYENIDVVVAREATEDAYAGLEFSGAELSGLAALPPGAMVALKLVSPRATERAAAAVFRWAASNGRRRVTIGHKATALPLTDGLFLRAASAVGPPVGLIVDDRAVDLLAADLVRRPEELDVLLLPNQYGDILGDLVGGLIGSVGLVPGANLGDSVAVFEPGHGSAPAHAEARRANPAAAILSGALLLRHLGEDDAADAVESAVAAVLADGSAVTYDVHVPGPVSPPPVTTPEMGAAIAEAVRAGR